MGRGDFPKTFLLLALIGNLGKKATCIAIATEIYVDRCACVCFKYYLKNHFNSQRFFIGSQTKCFMAISNPQ